MDFYFLENWHVLRLVTLALLVVAFVVLAMLARALQLGYERRRKSRANLGEGKTVSGTGVALPAPRTPASWLAKAADSGAERRAA